MAVQTGGPRLVSSSHRGWTCGEILDEIKDCQWPWHTVADVKGGGGTAKTIVVNSRHR